MTSPTGSAVNKLARQIPKITSICPLYVVPFFGTKAIPISHPFSFFSTRFITSLKYYPRNLSLVVILFYNSHVYFIFITLGLKFNQRIIKHKNSNALNYCLKILLIKYFIMFCLYNLHLRY